MKDIGTLFNNKNTRNILLKCSYIDHETVNRATADNAGSTGMSSDLVKMIKSAKYEDQPPNEILRGFLLVPKELMVGADMKCYYLYFESISDLNEWQTEMSMKTMKMVQVDIHRSKMILPKSPSFKCGVIKVRGGFKRNDKITIIENETV